MKCFSYFPSAITIRICCYNKNVLCAHKSSNYSRDYRLLCCYPSPSLLSDYCFNNFILFLRQTFIDSIKHGILKRTILLTLLITQNYADFLPFISCDISIMHSCSLNRLYVRSDVPKNTHRIQASGPVS